jgi:hypothetical protein
MTDSTNAPLLSRRTAFAGMGAGVLGLALASARFARAQAQDATPAVPLATHKIVGAWSITRYPESADESHTFGVFEETGLYVELLWDRNVTVGEWRPVDESTVELTSFTKWLIPFDDYFVPAMEDVEVPDVVLTSEMGTARVPVKIDLGDTGDTFFMNGMVWLYNEALVNTESFTYWATGVKMVVPAP